MEHDDYTQRITRWSGLIPLTLFVLTAVKHVVARQPYELLWMCNVANVIVGVGLLAGRPMLTRVGALWIVSGTAWWLGDAVLTQRFELLAVPTHLVTGAVAIRGTERLQPKATPVSTCGASVLGLLALQAICRVGTPSFANVNFAFESYYGLWAWFPPGVFDPRFWCAVLIATSISFAVIDMMLRATAVRREMAMLAEHRPFLHD